MTVKCDGAKMNFPMATPGGAAAVGETRSASGSPEPLAPEALCDTFDAHCRLAGMHAEGSVGNETFFAVQHVPAAPNCAPSPECPAEGTHVRFADDAPAYALTPEPRVLASSTAEEPPRAPRAARSEGARAATARLRIEDYYETAAQQGAEREARAAAARGAPERAQAAAREAAFLRARRTRLRIADFRVLQVIGRGAFGTVSLVQKRDTGALFAMKRLRKAEMVAHDQLAHIRAERDLLAAAGASPWVVPLYYAFQDAAALYLVMEYMPGGDMMTLLIRLDVFPEDMARVYAAETALAIADVHALGFVHRDVKPDNILLDAAGHVRLSDFGLSTGFTPRHDAAYYHRMLGRMAVPGAAGPQPAARDSVHPRRRLAYSTVGTPDYIAPEVFEGRGYGAECDWWSLGAIVFEMLVGYPPFCAESNTQTYHKILRWREHLRIPPDARLSPDAEDFVRRLLCAAPDRLGSGPRGAADVLGHAFFRGIDWARIREAPAPFVPELRSMTDTSHFPHAAPDAHVHDGPPDATRAPATVVRQRDMAFVGYTFRRFETLSRSRLL